MHLFSRISIQFHLNPRLCSYIFRLLVEEYGEGEYGGPLVQPRGEPLPRVVQPAGYRPALSAKKLVSQIQIRIRIIFAGFEIETRIYIRQSDLHISDHGFVRKGI